LSSGAPRYLRGNNAEGPVVKKEGGQDDNFLTAVNEQRLCMNPCSGRGHVHESGKRNFNLTGKMIRFILCLLFSSGGIEDGTQ